MEINREFMDKINGSREEISGEVDGYCTTCGRSLIKKYWRISYDKVTGQTINHVEMVCPDDSWARFFGTHHTGDSSYDY